MENNITIKQHYVPKFYLANFANNSNKLTEYNLEKENFFPCYPKDICYEKELYETKCDYVNNNTGNYVLLNSIEKEFSAKESAYSNLLKQIIKICLNKNNTNALVCRSNEKRLLCDFVTNMLLRNPWMIQANKVDLTQGNITIPDDDPAYNFCINFVGEKNRSSLIRDTQKRNFLSTRIENGLHKQLCEIMFNMGITFLVTNETSFITSNFPVLVITENFESQRIYRNFYIPIHPQCAILFCNYSKTYPSKNKIKYISTTDAYGFNSSYCDNVDDTVHTLYANNDQCITRTLEYFDYQKKKSNYEHQL